MSTTESLEALEEPEFPFAQYGSLLGVQTLLLAFSALYLPRSSLYFVNLPEQASSKDKPQHPFLKPLTADPHLTLTWMCLGTLVVQVWWANWVGSWWRAQNWQETGGQKTTFLEKLKRIYSATTATLAGSIFLHLITILFGAPLVDHFMKTYLLSLLVSVLVVFLPSYVLPQLVLKKGELNTPRALQTRFLWTRLFAELSPRSPYETILVYPVVGAVVGVWIGAIPLALDWDRPWQAWPLPPAYAAVAGYALASWAGLIVSGVNLLADYDRNHKEDVHGAERPHRSLRKTKASRRLREKQH